MTIQKIHQEPGGGFKGYLQKALLLKPALSVLKKRRGHPAFWTMPYDTICRDIFVNGAYEQELIAGMCALVPERHGTVLDVGANMGNHGVHFAGRYDRVVCFEPVPRNCWILKANLHLNGIRNVTVIEKGLGEAPDTLFIDSDDPRNTNNGLVRGEALPGTAGKTSVAVARGDDEVAALGGGPILMIKVDVEGLEPQVIKGLADTIRQHRPMVYWEAFTEDSVRESREVLQSLGYEHFYHLTKRRHASSFMHRLSTLFGRPVYLKSLDSCTIYDGMNVASPRKLL